MFSWNNCRFSHLVQMLSATQPFSCHLHLQSLGMPRSLSVSPTHMSFRMLTHMACACCSPSTSGRATQELRLHSQIACRGGEVQAARVSPCLQGSVACSA